MTLVEVAPAGLAQWTERRPVDGRVSAWIGVKGAYLPCRLDPCPLGAPAGGNQSRCLPHIHVSVCLSRFFPVSLKVKVEISWPRITRNH